MERERGYVETSEQDRDLGIECKDIAGCIMVLICLAYIIFIFVALIYMGMIEIQFDKPRLVNQTLNNTLL